MYVRRAASTASLPAASTEDFLLFCLTDAVKWAMSALGSSGYICCPYLKCMSDTKVQRNIAQQHQTLLEKGVGSR